MTPSTSTSSSSQVPTFEKLGLRPLINCRGTYTIISGSRVLPQVIEAMAAASGAYVQIDELMEAVGRRLAELTGAEWGYIRRRMRRHSGSGGLRLHRGGRSGTHDSPTRYQRHAQRDHHAAHPPQQV